jgi:membrane-bound metal-dependent hydrolase YbcI (DUF457 family)
MDPITHGIAGALIGKSFFAKPSSAARSSASETSVSTARVAILAATLGAVFPDVDVFVDAFTRDPLAIARYHRGFTHSFVGLPIFAFVLAVLTRKFFLWYAKRPGNDKWASPSFAFLFGIYAAGIASHILLDGCTSFGTRTLNPFSKDRVAWDLLFIIDFVFTALLLVPQLAAWVHGRRERVLSRAILMWICLTAAALGVWVLARDAGFPFPLLSILVVSVIFAAVFFLPLAKRGGADLSRTQWCRIGFVLSCIYIVGCGFAHHAAMARVRAFAVNRHIAAEKISAIPLPISLFDWNGLILTDHGVYQSQFSLGSSAPTQFRFFADSPQNRFTQEAAQLEPVRTFLWFARFPVMDFSAIEERNLVEYRDLRFFSGANRGPIPFAFGVIFDSQGRMLKYGWIEARVVIRNGGPAKTK